MSSCRRVLGVALGVALGLLLAVAVVLFVVPVRVAVFGRGVSCGSVTFSRGFGPAVTDSATVLPPAVSEAAGRCATALARRTAEAVPLGLLAGLGLLGLALATGVISADPQAADPHGGGAGLPGPGVPAPRVGAAPVRGAGGADA